MVRCHPKELSPVDRCSCKGESFRLRIEYHIRGDGDIGRIELHSICSACGTTRRRLDFEIDSSGTKSLFDKPLVPCQNPKLLYDLKDINTLLTPRDIHRIIDHLADVAKCQFLAFVWIENAWTPVWQDAAEVKATMVKGKFLFIYAFPNTIEIPENQLFTYKKENAFWKRSEVIRIGSKSHVCTQRFGENLPSICYCSDPPTHASYTEIGLSVYIRFSNEFVRRDKIVSKSTEFRTVTAGLLSMLQDEFVSWRGRHCFDNPNVNVRIFGDRFRKKAKA